MGSERMAAGDAAQTEPHPATSPVDSYGFGRVGRTGREIATARRSLRRESLIALEEGDHASGDRSVRRCAADVSHRPASALSRGARRHDRR